MVRPRCCGGASETNANNNGMIPLWLWKLSACLLILREVVEFNSKYSKLPVKIGLNTSKSSSNVDRVVDAIVAESSVWCPAAKCSDRTVGSAPEQHQPVCNLCDEKFLIIISLGRSASTTLTWTLDTLPGIRMGGENNGVINKFKDLIDNTAYLENRKHGEGVRLHPWGHAPIKEQDDLLCAAQDYIRALYPRYDDDDDNTKNATTTILGFKTVRFLEGHTASQDAAYVKFLTQLFPCARFVVNVRSDTAALLRSVATAFHNEQANEIKMRDRIARSQWVAEQLGPERAYQLDSTEWTSNVTKLNGLVRWLGYGPECDFEDVLELNTKGGGYGNGKEQLRHKNPNCVALSAL